MRIMREISFLELLNTNFNLNGITVAERWWKNENVNDYPNGRAENVLSYTADGNKLFFSDEDTPLFTASRGAIFFISHDCRYSTKTVTDGNEMGHTFCVKFQLTDENGELFSVREKYLFWDCSENKRVAELFRRIIAEYLELHVSCAKIKSTSYEILNDLLILKQNVEAHSDEFKDILPAVKYIEEHYNLNTSVDELAKMCLMSNSYFRKRFSAYTGKGYTDYRNQLRIKKANELLSDSMWSIHAIAQTLGFYDTSHFYRIYKQYTGTLPNRNLTKRRPEAPCDLLADAGFTQNQSPGNTKKR